MDDTKKTREQLIAELEELRQRLSRDEYNAIIETTSDGYFEVGEKGKFIKVNNKYCEMSGYARKELLGMRISDVDVIESPEETKAHIEKIMKDGFDRFETKHRRKNGSIFDVEISAMFMKESNQYVVFVHNITDRKKAEEALRESEDRFQSLMGTIKDVVWYASLDGKMHYINSAVEQVYGLSQKDFIEDSEAWIKAVHPEDVSNVRNEAKILFEEGISVSQYRIIKPSGDVRWLSDRKHLIYNKDGNPASIGGIATDITESKKAEEALRERTNQFKMYIENSPIGVFLANKQGKYIDVNQAACMITGYSQAELLQLGISDLLSKDYGEIGIESFNRLVKEGKSIIETEFIRKNGSTGWWIVDAVKLSDDKFLGFTTDITERKRAEADLRIMASMLDEAPESIIVHDYEGRFLYANRKTFDIHGFDEDEFMSLNLKELDVPETEALIAERMRRIAEEGECSFEAAHFRKDGSKVPLEVYTKKVVWGSEQAVLSIATDITERKKAEKALLSSEKLLSETQSIANLGSWEWNLKTGESTWSEQLYNILGRDIKLGIPSLESNWESSHPDDRERVRKTIETAIKENKPYKIDYRFYRESDGEERWLRSECIFDEEGNGHPNRLLGFAQDITERKRTEEELRNEQCRMITILDTVGDPIFVKDNDHRIILANRAFLDIFGLDENAVIGKTLAENVPADEREHFLAVDRQVLDIGVPDQCEETLTVGDFTHTIITKKTRFVEKSGKRFLVGSIHDITERKQLEEERAKASKLESIGLLAGGIAHDFNNILAVILGNTSLAKIGLDNKKEAEELLTEVEEASVRAKKLTLQLLTFAKGGAPVKEVTELSALINETTKFSLRGSNVQYSTLIPPDLWAAEVDKGQISQVIGNLVINAQQAMPEGGAINIKAENVTVTPEKNLPLSEGNYIKISVTDKGPGISPEQLTMIFDPYFTTKQKGSGLGLATSYSIIHRHDGHITVDSKLGIGTTFHIYLPASSKQIVEEETGKENSAVLTGKILVMDDDDSLRKFVLMALKSFGNDVDGARDGAEAIGKYKNAMDSDTPFDVVIMDLTIPGGMGGKEAIQKLLEIDPDAKAIVSSGYADDPVVSNFEAYGFKGNVSKPFRLDELKKVLNEVLSGK